MTACTSSARSSSRCRWPTRSRSQAPRTRRGALPRGRGREPRRPCPGRAARAGLGASAAAVRIEKRIPVAAGLGGGSADAAAVLRLARGELADLREIAAELGADVPSQLDPRWPWSRAPGSGSSRLPDPPPHGVVLLPGGGGLRPPTSSPRPTGRASAAAMPSSTRSPAKLPRAAGSGASPLDYAELLVNDLEPAARSLRPEIGEASRPCAMRAPRWPR